MDKKEKGLKDQKTNITYNKTKQNKENIQLKKRKLNQKPDVIVGSPEAEVDNQD